MTSPVTTEVSPSDGLFCTSSFVVSFYVPKENQANPAPADGLHARVEAAALEASLSGTTWANATQKSGEKESSTSFSVYTVTEYNSPLEFDNRVNEIRMLFDMEDAPSI
ncbi:hypothetical protein NL676_023922 [Syzygium grande]|nr:hypothetical protein NL676_023922 [Syzygium grande]